MSALRKAFLEELKDLLDAELQLLKALPKLVTAARNEGLRAAFAEHQSQTVEQIKRLGQVFAAFEEPMRGKRCKAMKGLIEEAQEIIDEEEGDAALIAGAQKAEHYEIAAYGTLMSWAVALGQEQIVQVLKVTLDEEKATDKKLTVIAQTVVNSQESQRELEETKDQKEKRKQRKPQRSSSPKRQQPRSTSLSTRPRTMTQGRIGRSTKSPVSKAPRSKRSRTTARK